jgi:hypothetical protein
LQYPLARTCSPCGEIEAQATGAWLEKAGFTIPSEVHIIVKRNLLVGENVDKWDVKQQGGIIILPFLCPVICNITIL